MSYGDGTGTTDTGGEIAPPKSAAAMRPALPSTPPQSTLGRHLIAEFWGASNLVDPEPARAVLREAAEACGATVLGINLHDFGERAGFTGVAVLSESHISLHSWPEHGYMAVDVFMCGECDPRGAVDVLADHFQPAQTEVRVLSRGLPPAQP